jgi:hypothetical protein
MQNILLIALVFFAALALYRWGGPIRDALKRFDANNAARQREEAEARFDSSAHYRQTLRLAAEEVEEVTEVTTGSITTYLFGGEEFQLKTEAEAARMAAIVDKARAFYVDLDTIYLGGGGQARRSDAPRLTRRDD